MTSLLSTGRLRMDSSDFRPLRVTTVTVGHSPFVPESTAIDWQITGVEIHRLS